MNKILSFLCLLLLAKTSLGQTVFSENIGTPAGTTPIATYTGWQNNGTLTFSNGGAANPADVRITNASSGYTGASGSGNVFFTSTNATYGFSIESINALGYSSLFLQFGYRKESAAVHTTFSVEFWDGAAWNIIANTSVALFNEATNAATGWYLSKSLSLPAAAQFNGLKIRFVKTGNVSIRIDDIRLQSLAPCTTPSAQPTSMIFGTITNTSIAGSFTAAVPPSDEYLTVTSTSPALTSNPVDGNVYNPGDALGDGFVVARGATVGFNATGLSLLTTYYFFTFSLNSSCTGGPKYLTTLPLVNSATTTSPYPPCTVPASQPSGLVFGTAGINNIPGSFTGTAADEYLVLVSTFVTLTNNPVNGQIYSAGNLLGNATVVQANNQTAFNATGLSANTTYNFFVFSINSVNCINGPVYNITLPLSGSLTTLPLPVCIIPSLQPSSLNLSASNTSISGSFVAAPGADDYLIIRSLSATLLATPVNNTDYNAGDPLGGGVVIANSASTSFTTTGLTPATTYYFFVFAANKNCTGGTKYLTLSPLTGNKTTTNNSANNYYFGTFHAHSAYSDGNKDNLSYTPADDYNYAISSLCMDYLGISEHNHYSSPSNPGNHLATYHSGTTQANSFTASHPGFVAMYGMEWGTIGSGGHVVIYGDGMDLLYGWESGSGGWGSSNNYDVYVPSGTYKGSTGVFKRVNDDVALNTFATLAHPQQTDYNNLLGTAYDAVSDSAITGVAVESGPATSTNTTYTNPGSSMYYLPYYQTLLSKGYRLGPVIDHDNHYTTFGRTTYGRTAVIAPTLSKTEIIKAMRNMHFYATEDCDTKVDFTINSRIMGSMFADRLAPSISVTLSDATTSTASAVIKIMSGTPGSGSLPVQIYSSTGSSLSYSDNSLPNNATAYYYLEITNGSSRIISSPIWYTRDDAIVLPIKLDGFNVKKLETSVQLNWSTQQESNSSYFLIERSPDGRNWSAIANIKAAGNSNSLIHYLAYDGSPLNGLNYYRLKLVDLDGKAEFSPVRNVYFDNPFDISLAPNPAKDFIHISLAKSNSQSVTVHIIDLNGVTLYEEKTSRSDLHINTSTWSRGMYFVKVIGEEGIITKKILVQ